MTCASPDLAAGKRRSYLVGCAVALGLISVIALFCFLPKEAQHVKIERAIRSAKGSLRGCYAETAQPADQLSSFACNILRRLGADDPKGKKLIIIHRYPDKVDTWGVSYLAIRGERHEHIQGFPVPGDEDNVTLARSLCWWAKRYTREKK